MNILLLNDNPIVNKLVTLSAKKTSDELEIAGSIEDITKEHYDLIIVDDAKYTPTIMEELQQKISFSTSLCIIAKNSENATEFSHTIKKPFLPTDLIKLFVSVKKEIDTQDIDTTLPENKQELSQEEPFSENDELSFEELPDDLSSLDDELPDELSSLDELNDDFSLDDEPSLEENDEHSLEDELPDELSLDDEPSLEENNEHSLEDELPDELSLDDEPSLEENDEHSLEDEDLLQEHQPILDKEEIQEVQELLEDEDNFQEEDEEKVSENLDKEDTMENENIETQIEDALNELDENDLSSEISEDTLSDLDSLDPKEIKLALGEEIDEENEDFSLPNELHIEEEQGEEQGEEETKTEQFEQDDEVKAIQDLLKALKAIKNTPSLKGMKISLNISTGD
ncbi:Highly acidic protein [hydrothermal vent metagenome]|uniref:Highly acidic protein n=1 Tax=hydrothermal vent metagenome TaxID=652676 RepID=A0A1W1D308_9ZZZZ